MMTIRLNDDIYIYIYIYIEELVSVEFNYYNYFYGWLDCLTAYSWVKPMERKGVFEKRACGTMERLDNNRLINCIHISMCTYV